MRPIALAVALASIPFLGDACSAPVAVPHPAQAEVPAPTLAPPADLALSTIPDVAEVAVTSVVNIASTRKVVERRMSSPFSNDPFFREFFGPQRLPHGAPRERRENSLGSGVIVSSDGVVVTNNHVVQDAEEIRVTLHDGTELDAEIVGTDDKSDVAVIRLVDPPEGLTGLPLGDSDALRLGQPVLAIGNPFGVGQTVTMGIVSATGRANVGIVDYEDFIQTDAAINPGNSGGALVDLQGNLVGINTAIVSRSGGYQGIGFAIPSNMADGIMQQLLDDGHVDRGYLGVGIQDLSPGLAEAMDLDDERGVLISDVSPGSPAEHAGVQAGDLLLSFNDKAVQSAARLRNLVAAAGEGTDFEVQVLRKGKRRTLRGTLAGLPGTDEAATIAADDGSLGGLTIAPLTPELRDEYNVSDRVRKGVVVTRVEAGSAADRAGLREGDTLLELGRVPLNDPAHFQKLYDNAPDRVLLFVWRGGSTLFMVLRKQQ